MNEADDLYKMMTAKDDYINATTNGKLSWCYASSCTSDSDQGMEIGRTGCMKSREGDVRSLPSHFAGLARR